MDIYCEEKNGYLYVKMAGDFNPAAAEKSLEEWVDKVLAYGMNRILCDITPLKGFNALEISIASRAYIREYLAETFPEDYRLVFLETPRQLMLRHVGEKVVSNKGDKFRATCSMDEAIEWLDVSGPGSMHNLSA